MTFTLIKGTLRPDFGRPDGDSMRFVADDPSLFYDLKRPGFGPKINRGNKSIQLRYEAIDTMESAADPAFAQPATDANIEMANETAGKAHLFARQLGPRGRPIAFIFGGSTTLADGKTNVFLSADDIKDSFNLRQLANGNAYPLYYDTLYRDLRDTCTEASLAAKSDGLGVWAQDASTSGAYWTGDLKSLPPIYPKLWRRIQKFIADETLFEPGEPMRNFIQWLEEESDEEVTVPSQGITTQFENILETTDTSVKMLYAPHDIVVVSR